MIRLFILMCIVWVGFALPTFYKAEEGESSTLSDEYQLKLNFTFDISSDDHDYMISWTTEIWASDGADYIGVQLLCDGMLLNKQDWHPNPSGIPEKGWAVASGWKFADISAGKHAFTIWFRSSTAGEMVKIRRTRILAEPTVAVIV